MLNQRKLYVSMILSVMMIAMITIVAADDMTPGATAQNSEIAMASLEEEQTEKKEDVTHTEAEAEEETGTEDETEDKVQTEEDHPAEEAAENAEATEEAKAYEQVSEKEPVQPLTTEHVWSMAYCELNYGELSMEKLAMLATAKMKQEELTLMSSATDHIVNYHGTRYAISEDEYQVLLRIVEAEAPCEDLKGRMLVANVVLNRVHAKQFPNTISEVVFQKDQFSPIKDGMYFKRTPSELTIEAVERVLAGEDESQGALYFVARELTTKEAVKFFDRKLEFLFKHGVHEFFKEK